VKSIVDYRDAPRIEPLDDEGGDERLAAAEFGAGGSAAVPVHEWRDALVGADGHGMRLDRFLVGVAAEFSRSHLQSLIDDGLVAVDDVTARSASQRLRAGQRVQIELRPTAETLAFRPESLPLDIIHEDAHLLVVNKPVGLVVHPAAGHWSGTLLNALLAHHAGAQQLPRAGIVHRLDKDTSGLMVVGKTLPAVTALVRAIAAREVQRTYVALAQGVVQAGSQTVDAPIGRDPYSRLRMAVTSTGRPALTRIECLGSHAGVSRWVCRLHTGRTHQIRVHAASLGHPLVGDALYGGRASLGLQRQGLHAAQLAFAHPDSGQWMRFRSDPPQDLADAWRAAGGRWPIDLDDDASLAGSAALGS